MEWPADVMVPALAVRIRRGSRRPPWLLLSRYTIGSIVCFGVSEVVFIALFGPNLLGARGASIVASVAGVIPGYLLNRSWTWGRRGPSSFWREVVPYWTTALLSTAIAALVTGAVNAACQGDGRMIRTVINAAAYMCTYGVLFVVKFAIFQRLFAGPVNRADVPAAPEAPATTFAG
jgi:putative flippase GtrA